MAIWQENTGVKPNLDFVDVRFDNCTSDDAALSEKQIYGIHVDELEWHLNQGGAEPTHFKPLNRQ
ncbi:MAG: hypothetical protein ACPGTQ_11165 [Colwellia sp.]|mgnify:CR=1 FL=1|uniref:hypothetical protein n=1 Tax=Pseudoalteromonas TaxID=53246 RepID=UPI001583B4ED|nr:MULTISPECIES: hypothetical protein [Pseudoalteromonas]MDI4653145.1 hypothetical protein [Pseudoalteromonas shioyasakiensis]NUJ39151.1 hypothetical protein [Pseudoalteromonas sp. 0303]